MVERSGDEHSEAVSSVRADSRFQELSEIIRSLPQNERDDICEWLQNDKYLRMEEELNVALSQLSSELGDFCDLGDLNLGDLGYLELGDLGEFAGGT